MGFYKLSVFSEIFLGVFNIFLGLVIVIVGGVLLLEGCDYEVDYSLGKVCILNDVILSLGVLINVFFEDNMFFGF